MALLIYAGSDVEDLNDSLPEPVKPKGDVYIHWTTYAKSKAKLLSYFFPKKCNDYDLFEMTELKPNPAEGASKQATNLRKAGDKCDFSNWSVEKMIKCLMIAHLQDEEL